MENDDDPLSTMVSRVSKDIATEVYDYEMNAITEVNGAIDP
jgi:hypothetical protein